MTTKMEIINSIKIQNLGVQLEKIGDLLYHEGPLLSLYADKNYPENYYFYKWTDCDEQCNRWLIFGVSREQLRRFLFRELSLKSLLLKNSFVFLLDLDNQLEQVQCLIASIDDIPKSYFPSENSYFKEGKYTELADALKASIVGDNIQEVLNFLISEVKQIRSEQKKEMSLISQLLNIPSQTSIAKALK